jgi:ubiquinone/menaquinone biosynthesis C-methylase UbiE
MNSFDRVAGVYQVLEYVAFGRALDAARLRYVERLSECRTILVVGEGDGRFLERLLQIAPHAHVRCVDSSAAMLARAERRLDAAARGRVSFECVDARCAVVPPHACDAVVTMFVLDCLRPDEVVRLVARLVRGLRPAGLWLFSDFAIPTHGWRRWRAELWVGFLYAFFRWRTGLEVRALPPSEDILRGAGLRVLDDTTSQHGLLRAIIYARQEVSVDSECRSKGRHGAGPARRPVCASTARGAV